MKKTSRVFNQVSLERIRLSIFCFTLFNVLMTMFCWPSSIAEASEVVDKVSITVKTACTISTTGSGIYSVNINPGNSSELIGNPVEVVCNDSNGYDLYATGFSGDSYDTDNTVLQTTLGYSYYIHTATSGIDSYWSMRITPSGSDMPTIDNSFDDYHIIPSVYTKIAHFTGVATNSVITPTYKISVSTTQPAGNYDGKVKYTIVHPNDAEPPSSIVMQNLSSSKCTSSPTKVVDIRDDNEYHVQRLADGKCWMLDNLSLDLTNQDTQSKLTQDNTNASDLSLEYLKGEKTGNIDDGYATTAVSIIWNNKNNQSATNSYSYSDPRIFINDSMSTDADSNWKYGVYYNYCAVTAGSYCYGDGANGGRSTGSASEDICPSGWRLPSGGSDGEFKTLATAGNSLRTVMQLPFSGSIVSGLPTLQGSSGSWWTSTRESNETMYRLLINGWTTYSSSTYQRSNGSSIRCILNS